MSLLGIGIQDPFARLDSVLPAAGAYDATPIIIPCESFEDIAFLIGYGRGAVGGAVTFKLEFSHNQLVWFQTCDVRSGALVVGVDIVDPLQSVEFSYGSTAVADFFMSPTFNIAGKFCRISMKESGVVGTPGQAVALYYMRGYN